MAKATLTISSKNYSSWSLRGWLLARFAGLDFKEVTIPPDDADARKEILLLSPSMLVPCLTHDGIKVWDTLAIAEYLNEIKPKAGLLPADRAARAHCRAVCGEMHSGFSLPALGAADEPQARASRATRYGRARRATSSASPTIWQRMPRNATAGRYLFGKRTMADAMYAPVVTRFVTYDVKLDRACSAYGKHDHGDAGDGRVDRRGQA